MDDTSLNFNDVVKRLDTHEELIANLLLGFTDLAGALERLTAKVLEPMDPEERKVFIAHAEEGRNEMLKYMRQATAAAFTKESGAEPGQ